MYEADGFVLISVMADANSGTPGLSEIQGWTDSLGLTHPVLADEGGDTVSYVTTGFPTFVVIDREMTIVNADMWPWSNSTVTALF
jgi:hypothetical protein